jgi:DNA-binding PadR family transcriptional regulator
MSAVRMLVLGVVRELGQGHGYQVRRELLRWRADAWAHVAPASIYQALRTLTKHGLVAEVGTESGGGPERTVYRLTPDGETEFFQLVRSAVSDPRDTLDELSAAFGFLHLLPAQEVAQLLDHRVRALWGRLVVVDPPASQALAGRHPDDCPVVVVAPDPAKPAQVAALMQLVAAQLRADIDWSLDLASRIRDGTFAFAGSVTSKA